MLGSFMLYFLSFLLLFFNLTLADGNNCYGFARAAAVGTQWWMGNCRGKVARLEYSSGTMYIRVEDPNSDLGPFEELLPSGDVMLAFT